MAFVDVGGLFSSPSLSDFTIGLSSQRRRRHAITLGRLRLSLSLPLSFSLNELSIIDTQNGVEKAAAAAASSPRRQTGERRRTDAPWILRKEDTVANFKKPIMRWALKAEIARVIAGDPKLNSKSEKTPCTSDISSIWAHKP